MRTETTQGDISHNFFLTGTILLAGIDVSGLLDYGLRIALGAVIVSASKQINDYMQRRRKKKEAESRLNRIRNRKNKNAAHGIGE